MAIGILDRALIGKGLGGQAIHLLLRHAFIDLQLRLKARAEEGRDAVRTPQRIVKLDRLRLRGPSRARDEFHLAATAQNLR